MGALEQAKDYSKEFQDAGVNTSLIFFYRWENLQRKNPSGGGTMVDTIHDFEKLLWDIAGILRQEGSPSWQYVEEF